MTGSDVLIVGGGHNGLVAAAYLARAGRRVQLPERLDHVGGAAAAAHACGGVDARRARCSYLVCRLAGGSADVLGVRVGVVGRPSWSYTPVPTTAGPTGLLIGPEPTLGAIGASADEAGFAEFYRGCHPVTSRLWPTLT